MSMPDTITVDQARVMFREAATATGLNPPQVSHRPSDDTTTVITEAHLAREASAAALARALMLRFPRADVTLSTTEPNGVDHVWQKVTVTW
jgi:hypothetical protein